MFRELLRRLFRRRKACYQSNSSISSATNLIPPEIPPLAMSTIPNDLIEKCRDDADLNESQLYTGYSLSHNAKRRDNMKRCILYRLPRDVLLIIVSCLDLADLGVLRQTSPLFRSLISNIPTDDSCWEKMRRMVTKRTERDRHECQKCRIRRAKSTDKAWDGTECLHAYCLKCKEPHYGPCFSTGSFGRPRKCIGWEGKLRLCRHVSVSLLKPLTRAPVDVRRDVTIAQCTRCTAELKLEPGEEPPKLFRRFAGLFSGRGEYYLETGFKVRVCTVDRGHFVTKDLLRESLRRFLDMEILCRHIASDMEALLEPFHHEDCVCFRRLSASYTLGDDESFDPGCRKEQSRTKKCATAKDAAEHVGRFMSVTSDSKRHVALCKTCLSCYIWTTEGRSIYLSRHTRIAQFEDYPSETTRTIAQCRVKKTFFKNSLSLLIPHLDPLTYRGNSTSRSMGFCSDRGCKNYGVNRRTRYFAEPFGVFYSKERLLDYIAKC